MPGGSMATYTYEVGRGWVDSPAMKVFLSWSKEPSKSVALFLRTWLTDVIQSLAPWMSEHDIESGERSMSIISAELQDRDFGILVITPENQEQPWINFEAGALSKMLSTSRVVPYLFDMKIADLRQGPISQFQAREATKDGTLRLMQDINTQMGGKLTESQLQKAFDRNWPDLESELTRIAEAKRVGPAPRPPRRSESDKLDELLTLVREIRQRETPSAHESIRASHIPLTRKRGYSMNQLPIGIQTFVNIMNHKGFNLEPLGVIVGDQTIFRIGLRVPSSPEDIKTITEISKSILPDNIKISIEEGCDF